MGRLGAANSGEYLGAAGVPPLVRRHGAYRADWHLTISARGTVLQRRNDGVNALARGCPATHLFRTDQRAVAPDHDLPSDAADLAK